MPALRPAKSIDTAMSNSYSTSSSGLVTTPRHVRSRTQSISSDRPSTVAHSLMSPPSIVSPEAAFIAASAASQIVTNDHDSHSETWYDQAGIEPPGETALVSDGALQLANNFVDQLLFNIIAIARSTSLSALRPAVSEVLKPKLAKDAINQADEELREYLGGGEVEDMVHSPSTDDPRDWDLELVWKRTRLRCMVYSSLGDMEEEDEDFFMEQEHLSNGEYDDALAQVVSPAVAIFLTSIIEFMGEQVLVISGQAAFNRLRVKYEKELKDGTRTPGALSERIVVEELDMERVALDRTIGRLWRAWKKRIRSPVDQNFSRPFPRSASHSRQGSTVVDGLPLLLTPKDTIPEPGETVSEGEKEAKQAVAPSAIPLPINSNDVAEIEVPGLVSYSDDEGSEYEDDDEDVVAHPRPKSWMLFSAGSPFGLLPTTTATEPSKRIQVSRQRSNSLPSPSAAPFALRKTSSAKTGSTQSMEQEVENKFAVEPQAGAPVPEMVDEDKADTGESNSISKIVTGVAAATLAIGTTAAAGVAAMAQGAAPQTEPTPMEEDDIDDFEEPEILTSSRVSIGGSIGSIGGRTSPSASESGRPPSMVLVRSNSLRVIDVQGAKSPGLRSRNGSGDLDHSNSRSTSISPAGGISTPPIVEEGDSSDEEAANVAKDTAVVVPPSETAREVRSTVKPPVTESKPFVKPALSTYVPKTASAASTRGPVARAPSGSGTFLELDDDRPEIPPRKRSHSKQTLPTLPETNTNRESYSQPAVVSLQTAERNDSNRPRQNSSSTSSSSNKIKAVRNHEEGQKSRPQDVARNFEELLQNNQTLQYTLTPENMRDIDAKRLPDGGQAKTHKARKSEDTSQLHRSRSSSLKRSLSVTKATGLSSHPPITQPKLSGPVPRAPPVSMMTQSRSAVLARDARVPRESIADFADFIRTTGPAGGRANPPPTRLRAGSSSAVRVPNAPIAPSPVTRSGSINAGQSRQAPVNRIRLQAREAAVSKSNESSDLIDFIRRGPPNGDNNPRIPRNVAPFRTTMDSDQLQMSGASGGRAVDATLPDARVSQASTNLTESSVPSSINSQSGLLSKTNKPPQYTNNFDDDDMMPKRKQRRVRDPYAIDFSDEEDEDDFEVAPRPKPKAKKEESLIDFLNNYEPPPPPPPQPFMNSTQPQPKKKPSAPNLFARLRSAGGGSNGPSTVTASRNNGLSSQVGAPPSANRSGHSDPWNSNSQAGAAERFGNQTNPSISSRNGTPTRVLQKRYEPRAAASTAYTPTSDLADFLRDSEPPPSTLASRQTEETGTGLSRIFERRKKSIY